MTQLRTGLRWGFALLVAVGLLGITGAARGQSLNARQVAEAIEARTFGTSSTISHTVHALEFVAFNGSMVTNDGGNGFGARFCPNAGGCSYLGAVLLPAGALVTAIELEACDLTATSGIVARLFRAPKFESDNAVELAIASTPIAGAPGCTAVTGNLSVPHTIDNFNNTYLLTVGGFETGPSTRFQAIRVLYTLQVSPAPAVASFTDVPTSHPFFQFIEALARSGITSGCGGGNFCPDAPLTRGQMAVFLSLGLGLHFAP